MGLKGDINELKKAWPHLSLLTRLLLLLSVLISILSVSSLADSVYKFRGFIVLGIDFYRAFIFPYLDTLITFFNIRLNSRELDTTVFISLITGTLIRVMSVYKVKGAGSAIGVWLVYMYLMFDEKLPPQAVAFGYMMAIAFMGVAPLMLKKLRGSEVALVYRVSTAFILFIMVLVCGTAAISEGLTRSLSE